MAKDLMRDIRKQIEEKKVVFGKEQTLKVLKQGGAATVYLSTNCPAGIKADIQRYADLAKTEVVTTSQTAEELGAMAKKPFTISVLSVLK